VILTVPAAALLALSESPRDITLCLVTGEGRLEGDFSAAVTLASVLARALILPADPALPSKGAIARRARVLRSERDSRGFPTALSSRLEDRMLATALIIVALPRQAVLGVLEEIWTRHDAGALEPGTLECLGTAMADVAVGRSDHARMMQELQREATTITGEPFPL
jgi:hypothetical protein